MVTPVVTLPKANLQIRWVWKTTKLGGENARNPVKSRAFGLIQGKGYEYY